MRGWVARKGHSPCFMDLQRILEIPGWMREGELLWLSEQAKLHKRIVEVGSYQGRSTRALAESTSGVVYAVDPFEVGCEIGACKITEEVFRNFKANITDLPNAIHFRMPFSRFWCMDADMIFIDACHDYDSVMADIDHALDMNPKLLCGHDYDCGWPGVIKAVKERFDNVQNHETIWYVTLL